MSEKIMLPSGGWVKLRDFKTLKHGDRAKLYVGIRDDMSQIEMGLVIADRLLQVLIEEWSFELLPPNVRFESLAELDIADYDALAEAAAEAQKFLFPSLDKTVANEADPKADTGNSNA